MAARQFLFYSFSLSLSLYSFAFLPSCVCVQPSKHSTRRVRNDGRHGENGKRVQEKRQSLGEEAEAIGKRGRCIKVNASIYM